MSAVVREGDPGQGPSHVLVRSQQGRTHSVRIRADEVEGMRRQVGRYRRFRTMSRELVDASEMLARALKGAAKGTERVAKEEAVEAPLAAALSDELSDETERLADEGGVGTGFEALERACRNAALGSAG